MLIGTEGSGQDGSRSRREFIQGRGRGLSQSHGKALKDDACGRDCDGLNCFPSCMLFPRRQDGKVILPDPRGATLRGAWAITI